MTPLFSRYMRGVIEADRWRRNLTKTVVFHSRPHPRPEKGLPANIRMLSTCSSEDAIRFIAETAATDADE